MRKRFKIFRHNMRRAFKRIWCRQPARIMFVISGILLIAAAVTFLIIYDEGNTAAGNAKRLLAEYEQSQNFVSPASSLPAETVYRP